MPEGKRVRDHGGKQLVLGLRRVLEASSRSEIRIREWTWKHELMRVN